MNNAEKIRTHYEELEKYIAEMERAAKGSDADKSFFTAARKARMSVHDDGLLPAIDGDERKYTIDQAKMAACLTREEVVALTYMQHDVLKRLDRNKNFMWVIIMLLLYIASRFS